MRIHNMPAAYMPPPPQTDKPASTRAPQLQEQIDALQQKSEQAATGSAQSPAAVAVEQGPTGLLRSPKQGSDSSGEETSSDSGEAPLCSSTRSTGQIIDVMA